MQIIEQQTFRQPPTRLPLETIVTLRRVLMDNGNYGAERLLGEPGVLVEGVYGDSISQAKERVAEWIRFEQSIGSIQL